MKKTFCLLLSLALTLTAVWICPVSVFAESPKAPVLLAFGDSIAAAGKWQTAFQNLSGETVQNAGVGGNTSGDGLKRLTGDVKNRHPDVVFIGFGTNDASIDMSRYIPVETCVSNLLSIVEGVRSAGAIPILITPPPIVDAPYLTRHDASPFEPYG
ncbi:MAG: hypothetical protein ILO68_07850 [Clostridia bacterium]|nr:hypothetical protein [Clostridia bacterium]